MIEPSRSKLQAFRLFGGALGVVGAVALLAFLGVVGVLLWAVNVSLPNHQREIAETEKEMSRQAATATPSSRPARNSPDNASQGRSPKTGSALTESITYLTANRCR